ncbi:aspartate aminotransferase family protein [Blautia sp. An249]|uniref:aminotransferase family protein n=1 Tax=Blautia sp. An249 TaxID=1965603 RepID=UPI000B39F56E|nr:aspartate aminotransferase family protein [Blautia sp. An249]OUO79672.1 aspartate aminotransferase family protein [Blautia sp. An249]
MENVLYSVMEKEYPEVDYGDGMYLYDTTGKKYLDCAAGIAVVNIGHGVKEVAERIAEQAGKVSFVYGGTFTSKARRELAEKIIEMAPEGMDKVFLCSGGSEAMESLLKIARQYYIEKGKKEKYKIISRWQSYHGNTMGTLALGGRPSWREKYEVYFPNSMLHISPCNCYRCPYNLQEESCDCQCACELERIIKYEGPETVAAFVIEPITGTTSAAIIPPAKYMKKVKEICEKYDVLFCVDEVITGFGRTGLNFAVDHYQIVPDLMGVAKGLGSGYVPIGGVIVHKKIVDAITNGSGALTHSFTFSGNPLACAGAKEVLDYIEKKQLIEKCRKMGNLFLEKLQILKKYPVVGDIRGIGLLLGVEFVRNNKGKEPITNFNFSEKVVKYCFEKGVILTSGVSGSADGIVGDALQIAPPFIIEEEEIDFVVALLEEAIYKTMEQSEI